jgi:DNA-directed RNA polymerase subunit H (RpoH/RPB5)
VILISQLPRLLRKDLARFTIQLKAGTALRIVRRLFRRGEDVSEEVKLRRS